MGAPKLRTVIGIAVAVVFLNIAVMAGYTVLSLMPATGAVRRSTEPLITLYERLGREQRWLGDALAEARAAVDRGDSGARARLMGMLAGHDQLVGTLPLAQVPPPIRVPVARAEEYLSRAVVLLDETLTLLEVGQRDSAVSRLAQAAALRTQIVATIAGAQVQGFEAVLEAQAEVETVEQHLMAGWLVWLAATTLVVVVTERVVTRRITDHMKALRDGLRRVGEGDLSATIVPHQRDELSGLAEHFNRMTAVLRDRAEQQGRVAAAGALLAGAAHEVNNPLQAIVATADARLGDPGLPTAVRADFESMMGQAHRAGRQLAAIIRFLHPAAAHVGPTDVNDAVRETWDLVWPQLKADGIQVRLDLARALPPAVANPRRLQEILVHLLGNAHQAVLESPHRRVIEVHTAAAEGWVRVEVRDSGPGVSESVAPHLFAPFFTTRPGERAGLGLYTSRLLARDVGGDVAHLPVEDWGAVFAVSLPVAEAVPAAAAAEVPVKCKERPLEGARLLVVDDEVPVRRAIAKYLARRGGSVREAADGREALALLAAEAADVVLTDLRMPGLDGMGLYGELAQRYPALAERVLFLSGDVAQLDELGDCCIPAHRVLVKPVDMAELERRVAAVLPPDADDPTQPTSGRTS